MGLVLSKGGSRDILCPFCHMRTYLERASYEPGRGPSPEGNHDGSLILLPTFQNSE